MKEENDINKGGGVKKFRYVGPNKKETLPQQWSQNTNHVGGYSFSKPKSTGLDLDSVWSIKRNVTVSQSTLHPTPNFSVSGKNDKLNLGNTFYSRHKAAPGNGQNVVPPPNARPHQQKKWMRGSAHSVSNASSSPQNDPNKDEDDEFDFDLLSPRSDKWRSPSFGTKSSPHASYATEQKKSFGGSSNGNTEKFNSPPYFNF